MKYRAEIDGLRALAVVPVILFHAGFELFGGGFVGVDVFFVISGYLITSILIKDIENEKFSIVSFYEKRARRILPALIFVLFLSSIAAWVFLSDLALGKYGSALIGVSLFASNFVFWRQQGYFEESAELNPILHTWSLAVEEQYYLIFPIFLILAWRFGKSKVFWMIVVMALFSLLLSEWGWRNNATANFYLAPSRVWELFAGSIAAFFIQSRGVQKSDCLSLFGLAAIIFSIFVYDKSTPFPSVYALLPVVGAVLVVLYADKGTLVARILSTKVMVGIGLISYSAYLWHQPLFAYTRVYLNKIELDIDLRSLLISITFLGAFLSWKYIETPFRNRDFLRRKSLFILSLVALLMVIFVGYCSKVSVKGNEYKLAQTLSVNDYVYVENMNERRFMEGRLLHSLNRVNHVVMGSSRVMQVNSETLGEPILNFSVSGASIEDDVALLLEAVAKVSPSHVYIAADPWLLNKFNGQDKYQSVNELYQYWRSAISNDLPLTPYFSDSEKMSNDERSQSPIKSMRDTLKLKDMSIPIDGKAEAQAKKSYDGYHIYNKETENKARVFLENVVKLPYYSMEEFAYDERAIQMLNQLISYLSRNGVDVTLVLPPYHPEMYRLIVSEKPIFVEIEDKFRRIALKQKVKIIGSYDASIVGCLASEFYDEMHPKFECMFKIFNDVR